MAPSLALFGAGLLVGAGLALLLAPTSGRELREEISERANELRERVGAAADELEADN
ncbi:YtxH domain-containing protein [bacterium]|nr:YtxH domain-containing protein [bacterium]